jgi:hypothetical protein
MDRSAEVIRHVLDATEVDIAAARAMQGVP